MERYERQLLEIGPEGQARLRESKALIIGAGGLGSPAALYLTAAGVGHIEIADGDRVELSNLQRQILHGTADIGRSKAVSARESMVRLNPEVEVTAIAERLEGLELRERVRESDIVLDCTDSLRMKFMINDACADEGKPLIHGGINGFSGQVMTILPKRPPCYRCIFKEAPGVAETKGVVGAVCGITGSIQALEALKCLLGAGVTLSGYILGIDGLGMSIRKTPVKRDLSCSACGGSYSTVT